MSAGPASRRRHKKFCDIEGWDELRNAPGKKVGHTYELALPDGNVLRTRISRPANNDIYGASLWIHILETQLCVAETDFWTCVEKGTPPERGGPVASLPATALPAGLAHQLVHTLGLSDHEIASLSRDEAIQLMNDYWCCES